MSLRRLNPRRDANEPEVIAALEAHGFHVTRISGKGVPDLLISHGGDRQWVAEVKTEKGRVKPAQAEFYAEWRGEPVELLRSIDDAISWAKARRLTK